MKVYLIAGESSGDVLGGRLMGALRLAVGGAGVDFLGIGGGAMQDAGLKQSLFPMEELSVMGLAEILPKIPRLKKRISETVAHILDIRPDILVTIDSPDFCFRVAKEVKAKAEKPPLMIHYVAPTVWAWRPGRAKKLAALYDGVLCLLPFEPPYFEAEGMRACFTGHPMLETGILDADGAAFRNRNNIPEDAQVLGLLPGSRKSELRCTGTVLFEAVQKRAQESPEMHIALPTLPHLVDEIKKLYPGSKGHLHIITDGVPEKWDAFKACNAAMATSGTVGLELAVCGVPHLIAYKMSPVTWEMIRRLVRVKYAHLANIILGREVAPEFIQDDCKADALASQARALLDKKTAHQQLNEFQAIRDNIKPVGDMTPSECAAQFVLELYGGRS